MSKTKTRILTISDLDIVRPKAQVRRNGRDDVSVQRGIAWRGRGPFRLQRL